MKKLLSVILVLVLLVPLTSGAFATGGNSDPSVAIYVNGQWIAAKSLAGVSGDTWVEIPISAAVLKDSGEGTGATNYVRITSNVANGQTADTRLDMMGSACGWSNTYVCHNWWVDDDWSGIGNVNADLAIEGWNGSQWVRIHNDHDYVADTLLTVGNVDGSSYLGYGRNIWTENNTLANYTNFRIRVHMNVGTNLTVAGGDILNLFPDGNYHDCTFCEVCGGCKSDNCALGHVLCTCSQPEIPDADPSVAIYVNGQWIAAKSLAGISGDAWVEIPISAAVLKDSGEGSGATNFIRIASNVANGSSADTRLDMLGSACGWTNTYVSHNWWVDDDWSGIGNVNADLAIEGWNGSQWVRIHNDHDYVADTSLTLGNVGGSSYLGYARNIWTDNNTLANYTNFRIRVHMNVGANLSVVSGDILNLFPEGNYHDCTFCETCGGCQSENCTLGHVLCTCNQPVIPEIDPAVAIYVNGQWVAAKSLAGVSGDTWVEFPISASILRDSGEGSGATNFVRIASNVANGQTDDTRLVMLGSACGWTNTYVSHNWWVDDDWSGIGDVNADLAIEGWNGTQWVRIHNDHDFVADTSLILGNVGNSDYLGYVRNIWTDNNTLANYTNFRIRVHMNVGANITAIGGDIMNLFPEGNYHDCTFCETCGGCKSDNCTLGHVLCTCVEPCSGPHTWGDWTVTTEPTTTEPGVETRTCIICGFSETREIPSLGISWRVDNYDFIINNAVLDDGSYVNAIRFAPGVWETSDEIRNAPDMVTLSETLCRAYTDAEGKFTYTMMKGGVYSFWIRYKNPTTSKTNVYILKGVDITNFTPVVGAVNGLTVTIDNIYLDENKGVKDIFISRGELNTFEEIKDNENKIVQVSAAKIETAAVNYGRSYRYLISYKNASADGKYTIAVRFNDTTRETVILHYSVEYPQPEIIVNGIQSTVTALEGIKCVRVAPGEWEDASAVKKAPGVRVFTSKTVLKDKTEYTIQYRTDGPYTLSIEYDGGYTVVETIQIEHLKPTVTVNADNTVTLGNLDQLYIVRYAPNPKNSTDWSQGFFKQADGNRYAKTIDLAADGTFTTPVLPEIVFRKNNVAQTSNIWSFMVQYTEESYNIFTVNFTDGSVTWIK